jgi:hypothetical protein
MKSELLPVAPRGGLSRHTVPCCLLAGAAALLAFGCSSSDRGVTVSGKVLYKSGPVPRGRVALHPKKGAEYRTYLKDDGTFEIPSVREGEYVLTVDTRPEGSGAQFLGAPGGDGQSKPPADVQAKMKEAKNVPDAKKIFESMKKRGSGPAQPAVAIPLKYADPKTSGLVVSVGTSNVSQEFTLTP